VSIFTLLFGDPAAKSLALTHRFDATMRKLKLARASGNKAAELAAIAELSRIAAGGSAAAKKRFSL